MNKQINIKDDGKLIRIFKVISWLDDKRWQSATSKSDFINHHKEVKEHMNNYDKILTHWICYITDRQMPYEKIWNKGGYVFSELAFNYSHSSTSPKRLVSSFYKKGIEDNEKRLKIGFWSSDKKFFASRYHNDDKEKILQTLEGLNSERFNRNIIKYITSILQEYESFQKDDLLTRVACGLYLLTYKKMNSNKLENIVFNGDTFSQYLKEFKNTSTEGKKRLWCCIRDYKKGVYNKIFNKALREIYGKEANKLISLWNRLPMNQIELPGDVWNNSPIFRDNLFRHVIDFNDIKKTWDMPKIIRKLYRQVEDDKELYEKYPEQFDITFDFVPRMCNKKLCNVCPFGKNGAESICIPTDDKKCPVALVCGGYDCKCIGENGNCIIKENIGKGICSGIK